MKRSLLVLSLFFLAACGQITDHSSFANFSVSAGDKFVIVAGTNDGSMVGSISTIKLDGEKTVASDQRTIDAWPSEMKVFGNLVYTVNFNKITVIDFTQTDKIMSYEISGNPQDIIVIGNKAYITRYQPENTSDTSDVIIVEPLTGKKLGGIELAMYMTPDGEQLARASKMIKVGKYIYVACQDLPKSFTADTNGKLVVIDTETDTVVTKIDLAGRDPWSLTYSTQTKKIYVTDAGVFDPVTYATDTNDAFGGIEIVDQVSNASEGIKIDDKNFGGYPTFIKIASAEKGYVIAGSSKLASFNPSTYEVTNADFYKSPSSSMYVYLPDFDVMQNGQILIAERDPYNAGIVFLNPDGSKAEGPISVGSAPAQIEYLEIE